MTQVKSAQEIRRELALRKRADGRTLAQRRAAFAAQMRDMALSDLSQVSVRLKGLKREVQRADGREWSDHELANAMKIAPRTFQSWQNGEVENRDGKGYDKMARWYSRKLGRKITRNWIVFGDEPIEPEPSPPASSESQLSDAVAALREDLEATRTKLLVEIGKVRRAQEALQRSQGHPGHKPGANDN